MPDIKEKLVELIAIGGFFSRSVDAEKCVDYLIANGVTIQRWISVEERLPTAEDADVACGAVLAIHKRMKRKCWYWRNVADNPFEFTCWMPLPEPPKGGAGDG